MAFVTKEWKDRLVEFAGRRKLKNVTTGAETTYDVTRAEGSISQAGDAFSAPNMNNLEQRIKTEFDSVNQSLNVGNLDFDYVANDGLYYNVKVGADTVRKKCSAEIIDCGIMTVSCSRFASVATFDITKYCKDYKTLTVDNFAFTLLSVNNNQNSTAAWDRTFKNSYNQSTGMLRTDVAYQEGNPVSPYTTFNFNIKIIK